MLFFAKLKRPKAVKAEEIQATEEKKVTYTFSSVFPSKEIYDEVWKILHEQKKEE